MSQRLPRSLFVFATAALLAVVIPQVAVAKESEPVKLTTQRYQGPIVDDAATRAALHRLARTESMAAVQLVATETHVVAVRVAGDEEFRTYYGSSAWKNAATDRVETADNAMSTRFGINLVIGGYFNVWDSSPDGTPTCSTLLSDLRNDVPLAGREIVVGYTKQAMSDATGCALNNYVLIGYQGPVPDWKVTQHEVSHLYGADDAHGIHPDDVMEDIYNHANEWCTYLQGAWDHAGTIQINSDKYD